MPIDYGVKVTGRINRYNLGFLQVQTRKLGEASTSLQIPRDQFNVLRVKRDVLKRSYIGKIFINRHGATSTGGNAYNRVAGVDSEFNLTDYYKATAFWMGSITPGVLRHATNGTSSRLVKGELVAFLSAWRANVDGVDSARVKHQRLRIERRQAASDHDRSRHTS